MYTFVLEISGWLSLWAMDQLYASLESKVWMCDYFLRTVFLHISICISARCKLYLSKWVHLCISLHGIAFDHLQNWIGTLFSCHLGCSRCTKTLFFLFKNQTKTSQVQCFIIEASTNQNGYFLKKFQTAFDPPPFFRLKKVANFSQESISIYTLSTIWPFNQQHSSDFL